MTEPASTTAPAAGVVDLSMLMPVETYDLEIRAPGGVKGTGWVWTLCGMSHPKALARSDQALKDSLRREDQIRQQQANGRKVKIDGRTPEEVRRENAEWIASRTLGFTPIRIATIQAEPITWSDATVIELMMRPDMHWVLSQLVEYLNSETAFTPRSATI